MYANGGHTLASLAAWLNEKDLRPATRKNSGMEAEILLLVRGHFLYIRYGGFCTIPFFTGKVYIRDNHTLARIKPSSTKTFFSRFRRGSNSPRTAARRSLRVIDNTFLRG